MTIAAINTWDQKANAERAARERRQRGRPSFPDPAAFDADDPRMVEARRRLVIVRFAAQLGGGMPSRRDRVALAITSPKGELRNHGPAPSLSSLQRWMRRYEAAGKTIAGLIDAPSTGRTSQDITGPVAKYLRKLVRGKAAHYRVSGLKGRPRWERLTERIAGFAAGKDLPVPSKYAVRRFVLSMGPDALILSELGTKAARALSAPKAVNPTDRPHELVFLDEVMLPTWIRVWDEKLRLWLAARAWALFMIDAHSRAILGFWVKKPDYSRATRLLHTHATAEEVIGFAASIFVPELAHPDFVTFARGEPGELRLDGSGNTAAAARSMADRQINATLGEANVPWTRGTMERYFQTLKDRDLSDLTGDKGLFLPFDPERVDPRTTRTRDNADKRRMEPYQCEVPVASLGEYEHLVAAVHHAVTVYNNHEHRAIGKRTPLSLYEEKAPRPGVDAGLRSPIVGLFPQHALTVEPRGVEARNVWYNCEALQRIYGHTHVMVRRDPLGRGVFVYPRSLALRARTSGLFVPTRDTWARAMAPNEFSRAVREDYRKRRQVVNDARDEVRQEDIGPEAATDVKADIAERAQRGEARRRKRGPTITADGEDTSTTGRVMTGGRRRRGGRPKKVTASDGRTDLHPAELRRERLAARTRAADAPTGAQGHEGIERPAQPAATAPVQGAEMEFDAIPAAVDAMGQAVQAAAEGARSHPIPPRPERPTPDASSAADPDEEPERQRQRPRRRPSADPFRTTDEQSRAG